MAKLIYIKISRGNKRISDEVLMKTLNDIGLSVLSVQHDLSLRRRLIKVLPVLPPKKMEEEYHG